MVRQWLGVVGILAGVSLSVWGCSESGADEGDGADPCGAAELCGDRCVSVADDLQHCGACDQACGTGQTCAQGACACMGELSSCGASCTNLQTDGANCGQCGNACPTTLVCSLGQCADHCADGLTECGTSCTDTDTDVTNCGGCGTACAPGMACTDGACTCAGGLSLCGTSCVNTDTDASNCGQCGTVCSGSCVAGECVESGTGGAGTGGSSSGGSGTGGTGGSGTGGDGTGGSVVTPPPATCEVPDPWPTPSSSQVVGNGTAASCTEAALRQAVSGGAFVTFNCGPGPVTIAISSEISAGDGAVVDGGDGEITLDGGGSTHILLAPNNSSLSVRNLRFVNGAAEANTMDAEGIGGAVFGGWRSRVEVRSCTFEGNTASRGGGAVAVWTGSELTIVDSTFVGNSSWYGGAVYSLLSPLNIVNSVFVDNVAIDANGLGDGGAIGTDGASESPDDAVGGDITICGTLLEGNQGSGVGGGAYIWAYPPDVVTIDRTTVEGNSVDDLGGGMRLSNGAITVRNSSFLSNTSGNHGGALYLDCAPSCTVTNSTFYGNDAAMYGGAISGGAPLSMNNVTFASNHAGGHGGALFGGDWVLENSLFVDNSSGNPWGQARNCGDTGTGSNVLQWSSANSDGGGDTCIPDVIVGDPQLAPPADNGGPTQTMQLSAGSVALQAGSGCEATDQRGQPRDPSACDLGAFEAP